MHPHSSAVAKFPLFTVTELLDEEEERETKQDRPISGLHFKLLLDYLIDTFISLC